MKLHGFCNALPMTTAAPVYHIMSKIDSLELFTTAND